MTRQKRALALALGRQNRNGWKRMNLSIGGDGTFPLRYSNFKKIGTGAQGDVYSALDNLAQRKVVIKKLCQAFENEVTAKHAYRELAILKFVDHSNVIKMLDVFSPQSTLADFSDILFVMEHMDRTLDAVISPVKLNDHRKISFLTYQLLCGANYLHKANIIHRDLKPNNVAINSQCELKIIDFGLARHGVVDPADCCGDPQGWMRMTPYVMVRNYRAPEIFFKMNYNENADVWSIGCILAELFLGHCLFNGNNDLALIRDIVRHLGTPDSTFIEQIVPEKRKILNQFGNKPKGMEKIVRNGDMPKDHPTDPRFSAKNAREVISKMLVMDPAKRISTQQALIHSYVNMWYKRAEVETEPLQQYDPAMEESEQTVEEWMELIFDAIQEHGKRQSGDAIGDCAREVPNKQSSTPPSPFGQSPEKCLL